MLKTSLSLNLSLLAEVEFRLLRSGVPKFVLCKTVQFSQLHNFIYSSFVSHLNGTMLQDFNSFALHFFGVIVNLIRKQKPLGVTI